MNERRIVVSRRRSTRLLLAFGAILAVFAVLIFASPSSFVAQVSSMDQQSLPNNLPHPNPGGKAATFSTDGEVNLTGEYFQAQGTNGRSCVSCHIPEEAWSINPGTLQDLFDQTGGTHPVFNTLDANNPEMDVSTPAARLAAYSMLLSRGVFRRGGQPRANSEWELIAVDDPHGWANLGRLVHWRRVMPTINFKQGSTTVNWDGGNSVATGQEDGLKNQAARNITGAQQGLPATPEVIADIVRFEKSLSTAQLIVPGVGRLDSDGARGGPEELSKMPETPITGGRFDLFDAWINHSNPRRAQIARGQEIFNNKRNANNRTCNGCHNSPNNGTNVGNALFDIQTASFDARPDDFPLYTFRNRTTGEIRQLTDAGRGNITGLWSDLGKFKTPTLRALSARAPYFHNGIAPTLTDVVLHYEKHLGFALTDQERADLVAFLNAL